MTLDLQGITTHDLTLGSPDIQTLLVRQLQLPSLQPVQRGLERGLEEDLLKG